MYILKIKGKAKIPDYVQLRDDKYTLLAYFRTDRPEKALEKAGFGDKIDYFKQVIEELDFGTIKKINV